MCAETSLLKISDKILDVIECYHAPCGNIFVRFAFHLLPPLCPELCLCGVNHLLWPQFDHAVRAAHRFKQTLFR